MSAANASSQRALRLPIVLAMTAVVSLLAACGGSSTTPIAAGPASTETPGALSTPSMTQSAGPTSSAASAVAPAASAAGSPSASMALVPSSGPLHVLWKKAGPMQKTVTYWPAIDPLTGDIWVASSFESRLWVFEPDGTFLKEWGTPGSGPGQLKLITNDQNPDPVGAIAFAPDGTLYVADNGNYRIDVFDPHGTFLRSWGSFGTDPGQFVSPKGIATDGKLVYVADDPGRMVVFDTSGHFVRSFDFPTIFFSLAPDGNLLVGGTGDGGIGGVAEFDATGKTVTSSPLAVAPYFASVLQSPPPMPDFEWGASEAVEDASGRIFVSLADDAAPVGLLELNHDGKVIREWSSGGQTMTLAPDGSAIYMAWSGAGPAWPYLTKYAIPKG